MKKPTSTSPKKTAAELNVQRNAIHARERALVAEAHRLFTSDKGPAAAAPLSERERAIEHRLKHLRAGTEPTDFVPSPSFTRDEEIQIELVALRKRSLELGSLAEAARHDEAQEWGREHAAEWRELAREICLTAERLFALEEKARAMLNSAGAPVYGLAMAEFIGDPSFLGTGDPLADVRKAALKEKVVTQEDIRKAQNV